MAIGTPIIINGDFSQPIPLGGFIATGSVIREPNDEFAQLETDGTTFTRTLEQTYINPSISTFFAFDFAFSTDATSEEIDRLPFDTFPDSFAASILTVTDFLDILVVDGYGVAPDPSHGVEDIAEATPIDVSFDPSITIAGFTPYQAGITFSGRVGLWLPSSVMGEEATLYFDLFDETDGFNSIAAVDNISVEPIPEPGTLALLTTGLFGVAGFFWRQRIVKKRRHP